MAALAPQEIDDLSVAVTLTIPAGTQSAIISVSGAGVRYWLNGDTPDATSGLFIAAGGSVGINRKQGLDAAKFIQAAATATMDVQYQDRELDE
jgi:hypothetical protein